MHSLSITLLFVLLTSFACVHPDPSVKDQLTKLPNDFKTAYVQADDGVRIHYGEVGQGTPVILLHGYYSDVPSNWFANGIGQELAKSYRVVAIDLRGHGKSDKPHDPQAYGANMWQDVLLVMNKLGIPKAHVHGYSMGGSVMAQLLYHHPDRFLSAAFGGSGIPPEGYGLTGQVKLDSAGEDPREKEAYNLLLTGLDHDHVAMNALKQNAPWSGMELHTMQLTDLRVPVLAINGEFDKPHYKTTALAAQAAQFTNVILEGKSHLTTIAPGYMPQRYIDELSSFLAKAEAEQKAP